MNRQLAMGTNGVGRWALLLARFARERPLGAAAGLVVVAMAFLAAFGPWVRPFDPVEIHFDETFQGPSWTYLMGTDNFGRDVFSRLITAARPVFVVALSSVAIGAVAGGLIGIASAYWGGWLDSVVQRVMDGLMAIPILVLALTIAAMFGPEDRNVVGALALINVPIANRILRSAALAVTAEQYVDAARAVGASDWRLIFRHITPNVVAPFLVFATGQVGWAIIVLSALAFLGVASPPPEPSWGGMLSEGSRSYAERAPWLAVAPGFFIVATVFGFNIFGDVLRDILDPRLRGR